MQATERVPNSQSGQQKRAPRDDSRPVDLSPKCHGLRWQYSAHPALRPTVFVPGPVVAARKV
jgi:hypothetical protein